MKQKEFTALTKEKLKFDIVEDIYTYMLNDQSFFRKHFFPVACKYNSEKGVPSAQHQEVWRPVIDTAVIEYFDKFKIKATPHKLITDEDRTRLVSLIQKGLQQFPIKNDK